MKFKYLIIIIPLYLILSSCNTSSQVVNKPVENFEFVWDLFDRNYAIFGPKNVDWRLIYNIYRPKVTSETTDDELFEVLSQMLGHLNDNHVRISSSNPRRMARGGNLHNKRMDDFSLSLIQRKYLNNKFEKLGGSQKIFTFGWLTEEIGYFHFRNFSNLNGTIKAIDEIVDTFKDAKGIIIDVRANGGGSDVVGKAIADRFADRQRLYMKTHTRYGPRHNDFIDTKWFYVEPGGVRQFTRPVVLLQHRFSGSASENFALAMRNLPNVTIAGDFSAAVFADVYGEDLPNGWKVRVSMKLFNDHNGFCWEGLGIPPDLRITNSSSDIKKDKDNVLEFAIDLLNSGNIPHQSENDGLNDVRENFVPILKTSIESGSNSISNEITKYTNNTESYYINREELSSLISRNKIRNKDIALELMIFSTEVFSKDWRVFNELARFHEKNDNVSEAVKAYRKVLELNIKTYPWDTQAYNRAEEYVKDK